MAVSPVPGETRENRVFPFVVDSEEIIRFVDTPGFQRPKAVLAWLKRHAHEPDPVAAFVENKSDQPDFYNEVQLLAPVARGAGIIYVVDASRPMRSQDKAEMEILRMSGRPRMAVINLKENNNAWMEQWKTEFRRQFNAVRLFSAHTASYAERIALLESLRGIDQGLGGAFRPRDILIRLGLAASNPRGRRNFNPISGGGFGAQGENLLSGTRKKG